jgi:hypothetical protein
MKGVGCAILAGLASGAIRDFEEAVARCVEFGLEINPDGGCAWGWFNRCSSTATRSA